jgi:hypothetical protein
MPAFGQGGVRVEETGGKGKGGKAGQVEKDNGPAQCLATRCRSPPLGAIHGAALDDNDEDVREDERSLPLLASLVAQRLA